MRELIFLLLVLACPLAMILMMRGGHVIGPAISGDGEPASPQPGIERPAGHDGHH